MIEQASRFQGRVYRAINPRWSFLPESGEGAALYGGRFNPKKVPALYTSERFETAWLEAQQGFAYKTQPLTLCSYEVDCEPVIDLTQPETLQALGIRAVDLSSPWELIASDGDKPPTWSLAEQLIQAGIAGIRVQSFAVNASPADVNWVFWSWSNSTPTKVKVIDDENRLPSSQQSWDAL